MLDALRQAIDTALFESSAGIRNAWDVLQPYVADPQARWLIPGIVVALILVMLGIRGLVRSRSRLALLERVNSRMADCGNANELAGLLFETVESLCDSKAASLYLADPDGDRLVLRAQRGSGDDALEWESVLSNADLPSKRSFARRRGDLRLQVLRVGDIGLVQIASSASRARPMRRRNANFLSALLTPIVVQLMFHREMAELGEQRAGATAASESSRLLVKATLGSGQLAKLLLDVILRSMTDTAGCVLFRNGSDRRGRLFAAAIQGLDGRLVDRIVNALDDVRDATSGEAEQTKLQIQRRLADAGFGHSLFMPLIDESQFPMGWLLLFQRKQEFAPHQLRMAKLNAARLELSIRKQRYHEAVFQEYKKTLRTIVETLDSGNESTIGHSSRVAAISVALAKQVGLADYEVEGIGLAGKLHDVGMVGLPEEITSKAGRISQPEFDVVKQHPGAGAVLVAPIQQPIEIASLILHHHERFDGYGYPAGLRGEDIPLGARIIGLAEVFDAMLTSRSYREALKFDAAIARLQQLAGSQLDPELVEAFEQLANEKWWVALLKASRAPGPVKSSAFPAEGEIL